MTSSANIAASFGRSAGRYRAHALVQRAAADWLAEWVAPPSLRHGAVLELGAGPGIFTEKLLPWLGGTILATDLSPAMCGEGERQLPAIAWQTASAENPPAGPWDLIVSCSMLQWLADPESAFTAWRRALAPGGRILSSLFVAPTIPEWSALVQGAAPTAAAPVIWRSADEWRSLLSNSGLTVLRAEARSFSFEFPSAIAFLRSLHSVGAAPARRLSPEKLRSLLRAYEARFPSPIGVRSTWTFFRFEAKA